MGGPGSRGGHMTGRGWGRRGGPVPRSGGVAGIGPKPMRAGGSARACVRWGRPGAEERASATVPGGLNLIRIQFQTDSNHLNF
jgi:hypothetical protein